MTCVVGDNIISPLGNTTPGNLEAVLNYRSELKRHEAMWDMPEPFVGSLFAHEPGFEELAVASITQALEGSGVDASSSGTLLVMSSTKGEISSFTSDMTDAQSLYLGEAAQRIAHRVGITTTPIAVCNACISGLSAIMLAQRLLDSGCYDHAVVCGIDVMSKFVVSGFQSFKALSPMECRPFDIERLGLNLGEAVGTIILSTQAHSVHPWVIDDGRVRNDAVHISNPSNKGDGLYCAIDSLLHGINIDDLAVVNVHGTATMFNDQMEAMALKRSGLNTVPVSGLKGYYGHTMGASGIIETILTMHALDRGVVLGTRGFDEMGVSGHLSISAQHRATTKRMFVKTLSGFGGCNAALRVSRGATSVAHTTATLTTTHSVHITPSEVTVDGCKIDVEGTGDEMLTHLYKAHVADYPKFYKMDKLSRLGFLASELLLQAEGAERGEECSDRAIVMFNRSSSIDSDKKYLLTIENPDDYYPSPAVFVYTLPNIVTGEIALRNHYHGETSFYVLPQRDNALMDSIVSNAIDNETRSVITGWLDYESNTRFEAELTIKTR